MVTLQPLAPRAGLPRLRGGSFVLGDPGEPDWCSNWWAGNFYWHSRWKGYSGAAKNL